MNQRPLGNTGIRVSEIAFGGVEIGLPYGIGITSRADMPTETDAIRLLHTALDRGITFFDTARMYGNSEVLMGQAFQGQRDQVVLATKCRHFRTREGDLPDANTVRNTIESSLQESLAALKTDYVDIYYLHQADLEILQRQEVAETFLQLKKQGVIRATGVSTYKVEETQKAIESGVWDVVQVPFNLMDQSQQSQFSLAAEQGVGIVVRSVLFKGILSEKGRQLHPALQKVSDHLKAYNPLLNNLIPTLPALAIKFALSFPEVSSVLVGIDRLAYLRSALAAADGKYLDEKKLAHARELRYPDPDFLNLVTWDKKGWLR